MSRSKELGRALRGELGNWIVELPAGMVLISLNDRFNRYVKARHVKTIRTAAWALAKQAKIPPLGKCVVSGGYIPPDRRIRDGHNLAPTMKAAVDGLVDAGVWPDDHGGFVIDGGITIADVCTPGGQFAVIIRPLDGEAGA